MNAYCIVYPKDCSDPESHNRMWDNIGDIRCRRFDESVIILFSDLPEAAFYKRIFAGVAPEYDAIAFLVSSSIISPRDKTPPIT